MQRRSRGLHAGRVRCIRIAAGAPRRRELVHVSATPGCDLDSPSDLARLVQSAKGPPNRLLGPADASGQRRDAHERLAVGVREEHEFLAHVRRRRVEAKLSCTRASQVFDEFGARVTGAASQAIHVARAARAASASLSGRSAASRAARLIRLSAFGRAPAAPTGSLPAPGPSPQPTRRRGKGRRGWRMPVSRNPDGRLPRIAPITATTRSSPPGPHRDRDLVAG
jgi:hypothetical protein